MRILSNSLARTVLCVGLAFAGSAQATPVVVTPGSMDGWAFYTTDATGVVGTGANTGGMVNGPATPPLGTGSAHLMTAAGAGDGSEQLRNSDWAGTKLADITSLSYSTYASAWNGSQLPYLTIWLDTDNNGTRDNRIWFEPTYSSATAGNGNPHASQGPVALNVWQTWDALNGMWYSDSGTPNSNAFPALPNGPGDKAITFQQFVAAFPDATIINDAAQGIGGIRIASGFASAADNFDANVDNFTIGTAAKTITYDFELTAPQSTAPEPASLALLGLGLAGLGLSRRKRA